MTPPDCPTRTTIETDSGILATRQQSPMPVEPISGGVNLASSPCLSLEVMDMVNEETEQEPPSVPEDVALTPSAVQLLPRGCNQTQRMPTVVRIPPRECGWPRLTATSTPRIRRNWSTRMAHRPPPADTTTSSRLSHCAEGREREERRPVAPWRGRDKQL